MNKRDKKLNLKLNRLNEEDESTAERDAAEQLGPDEQQERDQQAIAQEHHSLSTKIHQVFKLVPYCEPSVAIAVDSDAKRLERLNHLLLERLCADALDPALNLAGLELTDASLQHFSLAELSDALSSQQLFNLNRSVTRIERLLLGANSFKQVPHALADLFANLTLIDLSANSIDSVSLLHLSKFGQLRDLDLSGNRLTAFGGDAAALSFAESVFSSVERLNLSGNQLTSGTSPLLSQFKNLKYLNLSDNNYLIDEQSLLPWQLMPCNLLNLTELDMSKNNKLLDQVANGTVVARRSFNCFSNSLRVLNLSDNRLVNVPSDIKELRVLEELWLDHNHIEFVPNELAALKTLRRLSLRHNRLRELTDTFCHYAKFKESLTYLDLSANSLNQDTLSFKLCLFENLVWLSLAENGFDLVPNALPNSVRHLDLSRNKLKHLMVRPLAAQAQQDDDVLVALDLHQHTSVNRLHKTKQKFDMNYDRPEIDSAEQLQLPHVFFLRDLVWLNVSHNRLTEVPTDFGLLNSNLQYLDMSSNLVSQVSTALCRGLGLLKHLDLSVNKIRTVTDKVRELTSLEFLNLSHNRLTSVNYELCAELTMLRHLDLSRNYLEHLPLFVHNGSRRSSLNSAQSAAKKFTFNLTKLQTIKLNSNKLKASFSLYTAVGLCASLVECDLSSNAIVLVDTDEVNGTAEQQLADLLDEHKAKKLSAPKLTLPNLRSLRLSDNQVSFLKGGFVKFVNAVYKLAPNLAELHYAQSSGLKLAAVHHADKDYCFRDEQVDTEVAQKLQVLDLSANGLVQFPAFVLELKNLRQIYFNDNLVKRIPNEFFKESFSLDEYGRDFKKLEIGNKKPVNGEMDEDEDEEVDGEESRSKRKKKKKSKESGAKVADPLEEQLKVVDEKEQALRSKSYLSDKLEVIHLNNNLIESLPHNFFSYFKSLREIKLNDNPLKDPPQQSVCLSAPATLTRNKTIGNVHNQNRPDHQLTSLLDKNARPKTSSYHFDKFERSQSQVQLPLLNANQDLKPLQSYMAKYKNREGEHFEFKKKKRKKFSNYYENRLFEV
ncbi:leucine rich repeat [Brachionus plicatilis]|uniref:Leucine rich repeat n=1 Tax=Brachionus plicatilis TaxID=10195 RepID=A0A3M7PAE6_BRAPC|nr:leucine rich repeat [Brachionus plicatilis]